QIPPIPASSPRRLCPPVDPDPSLSNCQTAPTARLLQCGAPPPLRASTQNPPSSRPALPGCSSQPHRVSCTPAHQYCRSLPPRWRQYAISVRLATTLPPPSRLEGRPTLLCLSLAETTPPSKCAQVASNTRPHSRHSKCVAPPETVVASLALGASASGGSSLT